MDCAILLSSGGPLAPELFPLGYKLNMSVEATIAVWEAYFRDELTVGEAASRLADLFDTATAWGYGLPDVPDAIARAEEVIIALHVELHQRGLLPPA